MRKLDFLVIGAAKSATTTLYELLKNHPELFIPSAKEVPTFSDEKVFKRGYLQYTSNHFQGAKENQKWGTVTPQYLLGQEDIGTKNIAIRIRSTLPDVKLIVLLRHPVERAYSHYKMQVQRGHESRSFDQVVRDFMLLSDSKREQIPPEFDYIHGGEYGKLLSHYYSLFSPENILIITTDELKKSPVVVVRDDCTFLSVSVNFTPDEPT